MGGKKEQSGIWGETRQNNFLSFSETILHHGTETAVT